MTKSKRSCNKYNTDGMVEWAFFVFFILGLWAFSIFEIVLYNGYGNPSFRVSIILDFVPQTLPFSQCSLPIYLHHHSPSNHVNPSPSNCVPIRSLIPFHDCFFLSSSSSPFFPSIPISLPFGLDVSSFGFVGEKKLIKHRGGKDKHDESDKEQCSEVFIAKQLYYSIMNLSLEYDVKMNNDTYVITSLHAGALLAARNSTATVFTGTFGALAYVISPYVKHAIVESEGKNIKKHAAAEEKDHALLYMHLNDLENNMQLINDGPKRRM
uniref:Uncharacterized protein n=1 Tax=Cucumis melo TaxID=3656 RepID=A0A9I9EA09_CUCME